MSKKAVANPTKPYKHSKNSTKPAASNNLVTSLIVCALLLVGVFMVYSQTFDFAFTNWDDPTYVTENPMMSRDKVNTDDIFTKPVSLNYHPITMLTLAWNYKSSGVESAKVYHQWNVWIHALSMLLCFYFILQLCGSVWVAGFTAAVFGLHPMHVESVAWIAERKDVLYVLFFFASCIAYLRFKATRNWLWYGLCFALFVLSVFSKAMAVVFPVVLVLIDYYRDKTIDWKKQLDKIPFFLFSLWMGYRAYDIQSHGAIADSTVFTLFQRLMFGSYGAAMYIAKFFLPFGLSAFYPYPTLDKAGDIPFYFYLAPLVWVVIGVLVWWGYKKFKPMAFGLAFFVVTVALVLQFLSVGTAIMADRYSYLPYVGIAFAVAMLLERAWRTRPTYRITALVVMGSFAVVMAVQARERTKVWQNSDTLWSDVIEKYPRQVEVAYKNRGNYWGKENNNPQKAYENYVVLKHMNSKDTKVYSNMGNVYAMLQKPDSAMWAYTKAIELDPKNEEAYINRGITHAMMKQYDKALEDFNKAEQITGPTASVLQNRSYSYLASGQYQNALNDYNRLLQLNPNYAQGYYYRGLAKEQLGQRGDALQDVKQARAMGFKVDAAVLQRLGG
jgi:protein O-mannosyl-transferase